VLLFQNFIYRSLKAITTIITRLDGFPQIELIFEYKYFGDILEQCLSTNGDVRQQALVLVSDIGVTDEGDIKQKVLSAGAVKTIIKVRTDETLNPHFSRLQIP